MIASLSAKKFILTGLSTMSMAFAAPGIKADVSVLVVNSDEAEGQLSIQNMGSRPIMLLTRISPCGDDKRPLFTIMPPLVRIEANKKQRVHFKLTGHRDGKTQRLMFVNLDALPIESGSGPGERQRVPIIFTPEGLAPKPDPWTLLQWSMINKQLTVQNNSPYVVRLGKEVDTLPDQNEWRLSQDYLLPGERQVLVAKNKILSGEMHVVLSPISNENNTTGRYTATIGQ